MHILSFGNGKSREKRSGALPVSADLRAKAKFIGAFAYGKNDEIIDLTGMAKNGDLEFCAPESGDYTVMYYWQQGTAQRAQPAAIPAYCVNYFDYRGFEALKTYLTENVLSDESLNEKIRNGDVQMFMDSLEYSNGKGFTMWPENFDLEFKNRKGYDVTPYMYLAIGAPVRSIWNWNGNADIFGIYTLSDPEKNHKILNDIYDVQTQLYMEKFMTPFKKWLNSYGIKLRAQISYGKNLEISQPVSVVDYPEAENRNQRNQIDMYRLWSGGAHLQNKILSSETGGLEDSAYTYDYQRHLQEAYTLTKTRVLLNLQAIKPSYCGRRNLPFAAQKRFWTMQEKVLKSLFLTVRR